MTPISSLEVRVEGPVHGSGHGPRLLRPTRTSLEGPVKVGRVGVYLPTSPLSSKGVHFILGLFSQVNGIRVSTGCLELTERVRGSQGVQHLFPKRVPGT